MIRTMNKHMYGGGTHCLNVSTFNCTFSVSCLCVYIYVCMYCIYMYMCEGGREGGVSNLAKRFAKSSKVCPAYFAEF